MPQLNWKCFCKTILRRCRESPFAAITLFTSGPLFIYACILSKQHFYDYFAQDRFKLLLDVLGLPAAATIGIVIYTAVMAERINHSLIETQTIAAGPASDFSGLFERHLMEFLADKGTKYALRKVDLVLSTPAFGLHPLGAVKCQEFITALDNIECPANIILYSPDAHFSHFINTLLWQQHNDAKPRADLSELAYYTASFFNTLGKKVLRNWRVWPTNKNNIRLFHFETSRYSRLFLVLSDDISISSDLTKFSGRSMPLPYVLREAVVGEEDSLFMKYQCCPVKDKSGPETALSQGSTIGDEFGLLLADYLLGRTSQVVFTYQTFLNEIANLLAKQKIAETDRIAHLTTLVFAYLQYMERIAVQRLAINRNGNLLTPAMSISPDEENRIKKLVSIIPASKEIKINDYVRMRNTLCEIVPGVTGEPWLNVSPINQSEGKLHHTQLIALLYLIARSGMGKSEYVSNRGTISHE